MAIMVYDSLTQKKTEFVPLEPPNVKIYVCGPTVYDLLHVGNFRGPIVFNFIRNWLEYRKFKVTYHANFTDVDDKIIDRAQRDKVSPLELAEKYIAEYKKDYETLGLRAQDKNPKVTDSMPEIIDMIETLIQNQKAYQVGNDVNFSIRSFQEYGKLSHRNPDDMKTAVRIEKDDRKKDPLDFALWKSAKPGEPAWKSPWGEGRPGWHIECSAMIKKNLGDTIDIHGGGLDLVFPHHENEIAQSEGANNKEFVKYWVHWNMINFGGAKMSKSLGNIRTGRGFMEQYTPEVFKYMMLTVHYRSTVDLSEESVHQALSGLARIYSALALAESILSAGGSPATTSAISEACNTAWTKAEEALDDDFNTAEALARLFEIVRLFNSKVKHGLKVSPDTLAIARDFKEFTSRYARLMSIFQQSPANYLKSLDDKLLEQKGIARSAIDAKVNERSQARVNKDWKKSDEIRDELTKIGISVFDSAAGSTWEVTK